MAKARPSLTLLEMEAKLGYKLDSLNYPDEHLKRFYSDLRPVPRSIYQRTKEEFEEFEKQRYRKDLATISEEFLPESGLVKVSGPALYFCQADRVTEYCTMRGHNITDMC